MSSIIPTQQQHWARRPEYELHEAAFRGSTERMIAVLSRRSINIDLGDPRGGFTPLIIASREGFSRVVRILLGSGANVSVAAVDGSTALHLAALEGHLAVTLDLIKAGADLDAGDWEGGTPLHMVAQHGHSKVMAALIAAGANVDSRVIAGATPLYVASGMGHIDVVRGLLLAKANPLLTRTMPSGKACVALDAAIEGGHMNVARELIQQVGIKGCAGASGGVDALKKAAENGHVDILAILMDVGVVDTGLALVAAAGWGGGAAVKFLSQRRQLAGSPTDVGEYVNFRNPNGYTALIRGIDCWENEGVGQLVSPGMVQLLVDAGANTTLPLQMQNEAGGVDQYRSPLAYTDERLRVKKSRGKYLTEGQLRSLGAVRRLLLRVEAVRAVSWVWHSNVAAIAQAIGDRSKTTSTNEARSPQLTFMLPILRRRRRGVLLAPLLR